MCQGQCRFQTHGSFTTCIACGFTHKTSAFQQAFEGKNDLDYQAWIKLDDLKNPENDHSDNEEYRPIRE